MVDQFNLEQVRSELTQLQDFLINATRQHLVIGIEQNQYPASEQPLMPMTSDLSSSVAP